MVDGGAAEGTVAFRATTSVYQYGGGSGTDVGSWGAAARLRLYPSTRMTAAQIQALHGVGQGARGGRTGGWTGGRTEWVRVRRAHPCPRRADRDR